MLPLLAEVCYCSQLSSQAEWTDSVSPCPRFDAQAPSSQRPVSNYRNWNPPLLGNLPDNFLRILPQQQDSLSVGALWAGSWRSLMTQQSSSLTSDTDPQTRFMFYH